MLSKNGVISRLFLTCFFFFLSGSGILTGWVAGISGILGTMVLVSALQRYSPVVELYGMYKESRIKEVTVDEDLYDYNVRDTQEPA